MSRTIRKSYTKAKSVSKKCRNHGGCPYCESNRNYQHKKQPTLQEELNLLH